MLDECTEYTGCAAMKTAMDNTASANQTHVRQRRPFISGITSTKNQAWIVDILKHYWL